MQKKEEKNEKEGKGYPMIPRIAVDLQEPTPHSTPLEQKDNKNHKTQRTNS